MARTADVITGEIIAPAWGNEIRDRTIQVFATVNDVAAWLAPNGSVAIVPTTRELRVRFDGTWKPMHFATGGTFNGTTTANGRLAVNHGMNATPDTVVVTPGLGNATFTSAQISSISSSSFVINARNQNGNDMAGASIGGYWMAMY